MQSASPLNSAPLLSAVSLSANGQAETESGTLPTTIMVDKQRAWFAQWETGTRIRVFSLLCCFAFAAHSIGPSYYPCIYPVQNEFDTSLAWVLGLSNYISLLVSAIMFGFWGSICDRYSRKWILFFSLIGSAISLLLTSGTHNIEALIVGRGLTAFLSSAIVPASRRMIADILPPSERGRATFIIMFHLALVMCIVPLLSGLVVQYVGWRMVFVSLSFVFTILGFISLLLLPQTINKKQQRWMNPFEAVLVIFSSPELFSIVLLISLETAFTFDLTPTKTGACYLLIGLSYITGGFGGSILARILYQRTKFRSRIVLSVFLFLILAVGNFFVGWSWTLEIPSFWTTFLIILACALLRGFALPLAVSYCIELQTQNAKSVLEGLFSAQVFMSFLTQMLGTALDYYISFFWTFALISGLMVLSCIPISFFIIKRLW